MTDVAGVDDDDEPGTGMWSGKFAEWLSEAKEGTRRLFAWESWLGGPLGGDSAASGNCSLGPYKREAFGLVVDNVDYMKWHNKGTYFGRMFKEDDRNRLKWSVPVHDVFKLQNFLGCDVVLPDAGLHRRNQKEPGPISPLIPSGFAKCGWRH